MFVSMFCSILVPNYILAQPGAGLNFDGINDYISIPHNFLLKPSEAITIEAWVKPVDIYTNTYYEI